MWAKGFVQKHCSLWLSGSSQVLVVCFFPCFVQTCSHKLFSYFHTHDIPCLPVAGLCRGSAPRDAWHRTQVSIPEPNAFTNPKPMATSLHAIQKKFFLRIHELKTSLMFVRIPRKRLASLRVSWALRHLWLGL